MFSCVVLCFGLFVIVFRAISREMGPTWDPIYYGPFMDPICGILAVLAYVELILACIKYISRLILANTVKSIFKQHTSFFNTIHNQSKYIYL